MIDRTSIRTGSRYQYIPQMDTFRTELPPTHFPFRSGYSDEMMALGSCFSEYMGGRLAQAKFNVLVNPFGILYNPISIAQSLERLLSGEPYIQEDLFPHLGLWHSFDHHGRFSGEEPEQVIGSINNAVRKGAGKMNRLDLLLLTWGTAHVFERSQTGRVVANCHRMPADHFRRRRLSPAQIADRTAAVLQSLFDLRPDVKVVLTVSPVRHIRDGLVENQRSKASLLLACDELVREFPNCHYFPAYELILDDLRDYRFFGPDLVHPSELAQELVWKHFTEAIFDPQTCLDAKIIIDFVRSLEHRPLHPGSRPFQAFLKGRLKKAGELSKRYPGLSFEKEIEELKGLL